jgi:bile acid:Na+ symporter, BASS family
MSAAVGFGLPALIMVAMALVGLELTLADLQRVLHYPLHVATALAGQILILPLFAAVLILTIDLPPAVAGGLVLAAAAPQATSSNFFCLLARADVALSVTLTAVSSVLAVIVTPLIAGAMFGLLLAQDTGFSLPVLKVMQQVATGLLLPVAVGMLVRHRAPAWVARNRARLQALGLIALGLMLGFLIFDQAGTILEHFDTIVLAAVLFMSGAAALGFGLARAFSWNREDTVTLIAAFPSRSLSIATLIAVNVLGRMEFLSFAVVFFLVQVALLVPVMLFARGRQRS